MQFNNGSGKSIASVIQGIQKDFGDESVILGEIAKVDVISTGSLSLDIATGIGGYPRGRISVLAGWEASGKTTHALKAVANLQKMGGKIVFIDTEYALDPYWAEKQGVDMSNMDWIKTDDLETAGEVAVRLANSRTVDMIVFDSVAGAPIKAVVSGELGDANMGKRAKIMSDFIPKLNGPISRNNMWMIFTNQQRDSLNMYNPKPVRPGGHALDFHSSIIITLKAKKRGSDPLEITAYTEKNKLSVPFKEAKYFIDENGNIDLIEELANILTDKNLLERLGIKKEGSMYTLPAEWIPDVEEPRFRGRPGILEFLASDLDAFDRIRAQVAKLL